MPCFVDTLFRNVVHAAEKVVNSRLLRSSFSGDFEKAPQFVDGFLVDSGSDDLSEEMLLLLR